MENLNYGRGLAGVFPSGKVETKYLYPWLFRVVPTTRHGQAIAAGMKKSVRLAKPPLQRDKFRNERNSRREPLRDCTDGHLRKQSFGESMQFMNVRLEPGVSFVRRAGG